MAELRLKKRTRQGHRVYLGNTLKEADGYLAQEASGDGAKLRLTQLKDILDGQLPELTKLDDEILDIISANEDESAEEIAKEIEESGNLRWGIKTTVGRIVALLDERSVSSTRASPGNSADAAAATNAVRLPKLEVKKFSGKVDEWQTFWDNFECAIHKNNSLAEIDKFSYLRGLVEGKASAAIAGFALTAANYDAAVELLKGRFGKKSLIQRAHIEELMKVQPVYDDRDTQRLRNFHDAVETHHRGLQALGVASPTYSSIVVPAVIQKLPDQVRLTITRGRKHEEWDMDDLLERLREEVELREELHLQKETKQHERKNHTTEDRRGKPGTASALAVTNAGFEDRCAYCMDCHDHDNCTKVTSVSKRRELIRKYGRCFICMRKGHKASKCKSNRKCDKCKGNHHVSICENPEGQADSIPTSITIPSLHVGLESRVALQTARAVLKGGNRNVTVRVMFDSGSHRSFITPRIVRTAGLQPVRREWVEISTFGQQATDRGLKEVFSVDLQCVRGGECIQIEAYLVPTISQIRNEHVELRKHEYPHLQNLWFSDVSTREESLEIELLIGADYLWSFQEGRTIRGERGDPVAVETRLGWVLSGPVKGDRVNSRIEVNFVNQESTRGGLELGSEIRKLWDFETLGVREEDEILEEHRDKVSFDGRRYKVSLPWKESHDNLPSNFSLSKKRLCSQLSKLRKQPEVLAEYNNIIVDQLNQGIIEEVADLDPVVGSKVHYLPHHPVVRKDAKTTKVRVVFDASSRESKKQVSLNDCLHVGPPMSPLLYDILLRFREKRIAVVGDIEKAFLNIAVEEKDRDSLRFLWVRDVNEEEAEMVVYRFCRVVFGVNCSPFLLNATLHHHLESYQDVDPGFVEKLKNSFYVDDLVTGEQTEEKAYVLYEEAKDRLASGGFKLRKWLTNSPALRDRITQAEQGIVSKVNSGTGEDDLSYAKVALGTKQEKALEKVLGMGWKLDSDMFVFKLVDLTDRALDVEVTKRNILKVMACLYDPIGLVSPILVSMKYLFQKLCLEKVGWDDPLSPEVVREWNGWIGDLRKVKEVEISRCVHGFEDISGCKYSLHGFSDASERAYCAVMYFVTEAYGGYSVQLLTSKTRIAPAGKTQTIPRLELMGCRILAKLTDTVKKALSSEVEFDATWLWSDSKTALCWIYNNGEWKQFVRSRVNEILRLTRKTEWNHCPGVENPADLGSRGVLASKLQGSELWWKGPSWLSKPKEEWPELQEVAPTTDSLDEVKKAAVATAEVTQRSCIENIIDVRRYSKLSRLLAVTGWVKRFVFNVQARVKGKECRSGSLTIAELVEAERVWVMEVQSSLRTQGNYRQLVSELGLTDDNGILRCRGRMLYSDLQYETRYPAVLPKDNTFTDLVIDSCHRRVLHAGLRQTLAEVRARFWVLKGRQAVKKVLCRCVVCKKQQGRPYAEPPMAPLPEFRVKEAPAFSKVGVDFAGPLYVKADKEEEMQKVYFLLWTCCVTRGVTLDLTRDLNAKSFLCALRRFAARRGTPALIVSDNAKTFKAANKYVIRLFEDVEVKAYLEENMIEWKFNLDRAPWWGGMFERMVGTVKSSLRKVLGNARLSFDELYTVLLEAEGTINSRPLTYEYDEIGAEVLTPSHLIYGRKLVGIPDELDSKDEEVEQGSLIRRFRYLARKRAHYWNRWHKEYLTNLREHHRQISGRKGAQPQTGDVVLVQEDKQKRGRWKMGIVERAILGKDQNVRGAVVRLVSKGKPVTLNRPVRKLYPLEIRSKGEARQENTQLEETEEELEVEENLPDHVVTQPEQVRDGRVRRAAALDSRWKTRSMGRMSYLVSGVPFALILVDH